MSQKIKFDGEAFLNLKLQFSDQIIYQGFSNPKFNKKHSDSSIIYHYTSIDNLKNIVTNQSLYFTNLFYLNDKLEFKYGLDLIKASISDIPNHSITSLINKHIDSKINSDRYIMCFSLKGDLLSQWRAYGNNGSGISIGFHNYNLQACLAFSTLQTHIDYDAKYQTDKFKEIIVQQIAFYESYRDLFDWNKYDFDEIVAISVMEFCEAFVDSLKHPSFSEENEYRFTHVFKKNQEKIKIKHRLRGTTKIPYVEIPTTTKKYLLEKAQGKWDDAATSHTFIVDKLPIKKIILGPCVNEHQIMPSLESLLKENDYSNVEIIKSEIPYRV